MELENKIKDKLQLRGFSLDQLLNNRGLIAATIEEMQFIENELRDEIAVDAMHATLTNPEAMENVTKEYRGNLPEAWKLLATNSYAIADAMIKAKNKPTG